MCDGVIFVQPNARTLDIDDNRKNNAKENMILALLYSQPHVGTCYRMLLCGCEDVLGGW